MKLQGREEWSNLQKGECFSWNCSPILRITYLAELFKGLEDDDDDDEGGCCCCCPFVDDVGTEVD